MKSELTLSVLKKEGMFKQIPAILSFYEDEVLMTIITPEKQKQLIEEKKEEAKESGKGKIRSFFAAGKALTEYIDEVSVMEKEDIMKENTEVISRNEIKEIKFKKSTENYDYETNQTSKSGGSLIIKLENDKIKFSHTYSDKRNEIKKYFKG